MKFRDRSLKILIFNCGSSSLKYKIIDMPAERVLVQGEAERVGIKTKETSEITHSVLGKERMLSVPLADHSEAMEKALALIGEDAAKDKRIKFDVFAHRYVHPGNVFSGTTKVTGTVLEKLKETLPLAAIHNPISYRLIEHCHKAFPSVDQYAVFDTAFHKTIPKEYSTYAIPVKLASKLGLRKIGFHGISHRYVMEEACKFLNRNPSRQKIISCHLGTGGSSVCAIDGGRSVNNSMGFTPLEGLMMNTRCGDLDPGVVFYIMSKEGFSPEEAEKMVNKKSGVLGIFDSSSDLRDAFGGMGADRNAGMAFRMYVRRVKSYISYYALILKKADILIFTDSLGTGLWQLREAICKDMGFAGILPDKEKNATYVNGMKDISSDISETRVLVIPTDEEVMMAREVHKELIKDDPRHR